MATIRVTKTGRRTIPSARLAWAILALVLAWGMAAPNAAGQVDNDDEDRYLKAFDRLGSPSRLGPKLATALSFRFGYTGRCSYGVRDDVIEHIDKMITGVSNGRRVRGKIGRDEYDLDPADYGKQASQFAADLQIVRSYMDRHRAISPDCVQFKDTGSSVEDPDARAAAKRAADAAARAADACDMKAYNAAIADLGKEILDVANHASRLEQRVRRMAQRNFRTIRRTAARAKAERKTEEQLKRVQQLLIAKREECFEKCRRDRFVGETKKSGLIVEPLIGFALGDDTARGDYRSTGAQAPLDGGKVRKAQSALFAGVDVLMPLSALLGDDPLAHATAGQFITAYMPYFGFGLRSGVLFQNDKVTYDIVRHGADGRVRLSERELANIGFYMMLGVPISIRVRRRERPQALASLAQDTAPGLALPRRLSLFFYGGVGPTFTNTRVTLSSNKVPGGGVFTSTSRSEWDTGLGAVAGIRAALCRACAFGNPLRLGFEWQGRWMPDRNVATTSPTFGFTESGRVHNRFTQQFLFTVSIPFTIGLN